MATDAADQLRKKQKVFAAVDLPGVPAGMRGKVLLVGGIAWIRYRVRFDNGIELGLLDRSQLHTEAERRALAG